MQPKSTRRAMLTQSLACAAVASVGPAAIAAEPQSRSSSAQETKLRYCLNTSTIRGQSLPLDQEIELVAKAGYDSIEPWIGEIQKYVESGGQLADLRRRLEDHQLKVDSAIGFANWIVDDAGLESLKRDMELLREIGGTRIAAPPTGATDKSGMDLSRVAERYAEAIRVGKQVGVLPQLELWGFSKTLSRLGELLHVAIESGSPDAAVLLDVYHIYKGGSDFAGLKLVHGSAVNILHMNDYPDMPRETIGDADRVYPGDGIAPISTILRTLLDNGFVGTLSLELFNRDYWKQDPAEVLAKGLSSMRSAVAAARG